MSRNIADALNFTHDQKPERQLNRKFYLKVTSSLIQN